MCGELVSSVVVSAYRKVSVCFCCVQCEKRAWGSVICKPLIPLSLLLFYPLSWLDGGRSVKPLSTDLMGSDF